MNYCYYIFIIKANTNNALISKILYFSFVKVENLEILIEEKRTKQGAKRINR